VRNLRLLAGLLVAASCAIAADPLVYVGTYTKNGSRGIYAFRFNSASGKLSSLGLAAESESPSFLAEHPNHKFLYAVNEAGRTGEVSAFAIDAKSGKLTFLNKVSSGGNSPCHLAVDRSGKWVVVANYGDGVLTIYPIGADGKLGEAATTEKHTGSSADPSRQKGPHGHEAVFSPDGKFLLFSDLGLDKIFIYKWDSATGKITPNDPPSGSVPAGAGVRHFAFHPNGRTVYSINEIGNSVTAFHYDPAKGSLDAFQTLSTLPDGFKGPNSTAEIAVDRAGKHVYGSNRGHDSIALFTVNPTNMTLTRTDDTPVLGKTPRDFVLDPTGKFLIAANQDSSDITIFKVQPNSGQLMPAGQPVKDAPMPVCVLFVGARN
jgi:6-phosphogluconolactonase